MKKVISAAFIGGFVISACAQKVEAPDAVKSAFNTKFSAAQGVVWEQEGEAWEADFKMKNVKMSASFDVNGGWLATETEMKTKEAPEVVTSALEKGFAGWELEELESVEMANFQGYEVSIEKDEKEMEVLISSTGEIVNKQMEEENEEDED